MKRSIFLILFSFFGFVNGCGQAGDASNTENIRIKVGRSPGSIEAGDFNNDKFIDLAVASETDSTVTILLGNGKGSFTGAAGSPFFAGPQPNDIAIKDFNNDGNPDLAFANHENKFLTVLLGNGKGSFTAAAKSPFRVEGIPHTHGIATGDFKNAGSVF